jgi:predicted glycosyltransferase
LRLLFDVLHPAHVHFFRHLAETARNEGGEVLFTARRKDVTVELLEAFGLPHETLSEIGGGPLGLARELALRSAALARRARQFQPQLLLGIMGPAIAPVGRLLRIPSWVFYDTETARLTNSFVFPLCSRLYLPSAYGGRAPKKAIQYEGFQEIAYLHPNRFVPDPSIRQEAGIGPDEPFAVLRLVSWEASHDLGDRGLGDPLGFVTWLQKRIRVVVTGERGLPPELRPLSLRVAPHRIHHLLAAASLYVGEGATMATESALLGTPAIFVHSARLGCMRALEERWDLLRTRTDTAEIQRICEDLLADPATTKQRWSERRRALFDGCVDVGAWMLDEVRAATGG